MRVLVAGGGIGGLAAALSLYDAGITDITVVDAALRIRPLGLGISLLPHAVRELAELDLYHPIANLGVPLSQVAYPNPAATRVVLAPRGQRAGYLWPHLSVPRGELQVALLRAVYQRLGRSAVRTGGRLTGFRQDDAGVYARFVDAEGRSWHERADVLIGADGVNSATRATLFPDEDPPLAQPRILMRGTTRCPPFADGHTMIMSAHGEARFMAHPIKPIDPRDGYTLTNWLAELPDRQSAGELDDSGWNGPADLRRLGRVFRGWSIAGADIGAMVRTPTEASGYPLVTRAPLEQWSFGRVTLLGDAAHPLYPYVLGGASESIVDARVLARALAGHDDPVEALEEYERARLPLNKWLQLIGHGRVPRAAEATGPLGAAEEIGGIIGAYGHLPGHDPKSLNTRATYGVPARATSAAAAS
ncbi:FAD-dependent monooxygenase [Streptomyces sp. SID3343]|uniref:FAD-dependent monooxygenase n=1 Tax=Streptomyces sp. SID3343 TaxID=2690260 RepID=UPI0013699E3A|nr:flavin-dependent oxidoreductase [Streptomyces sp. SID3343]